MDSFRPLPDRFDTTTESWKGFNYLYFIVLALKKFRIKKSKYSPFILFLFIFTILLT